MEKNKKFGGVLREILDRIKETEGLKFDTDVAVPLKVTKRNISNFKDRDSIPWEKLLEYSRLRKVSMEWLINGRGPVKSDNFSVCEPEGLYTIETNQDAVYDISAQVYAELESQHKKAAPEKFRQLVKLLHRQTLESGTPPAADKIKELVLLI